MSTSRCSRSTLQRRVKNISPTSRPVHARLRAMNWVQEHGDGVVLSVKGVPRSSKTVVCGLHGDSIKIKLQAPPVEGKAHKQLLKFLRKELGVSAAALTILSGETAKQKRVLIRDMAAADAAARLLPAEGAES